MASVRDFVITFFKAEEIDITMKMKNFNSYYYVRM